jgi:hypothetical protein
MENQVCVSEEKRRIERTKKIGRDEGRWKGTYIEKKIK